MSGHRRARALPAEVESHARTSAFVLALALLAASDLSGCGKSTEELDKQATARRLVMEKALAASLAEEREKDRRMRDGAAAQASERIASDAAEHERDLAQTALARAVVTPQQQEAERAGVLRKYADKLRQSTNDPASVQMRSAELSPRLNGMCAEFNAKTKAGTYAGFKRAVVTDFRVAVEEPPTKELMTQFLLFQIAARDTGCFPDVQSVRILE
jgi:hypothetical protein